MKFCTHSILWQGTPGGCTHTLRNSPSLCSEGQVPSSDAPFQILPLEDEQTILVDTLHVLQPKNLPTSYLFLAQSIILCF